MKNFWNHLVEDDVIQIQSRSMSDLTLSDIGFKNKMTWVRTTLKTEMRPGNDPRCDHVRQSRGRIRREIT